MNLIVNEFNNTQDVRQHSDSTRYTVFHLEDNSSLRTPFHIGLSRKRGNDALMTVNLPDFTWLEPAVFADKLYTYLQNKSADVKVLCTDVSMVDAVVSKLLDTTVGPLNARGLSAELIAKVIEVVEDKTLVHVRQTNELLFQSLLDRVRKDFENNLTKTLQVELRIKLA